jgi:hypothetical protein
MDLDIFDEVFMVFFSVYPGKLYSDELQAGRQEFDYRHDQDFFLFRCAHPPSYPVGTGGSFLKG